MNSNTVKQYVEEFRKKLALDLPENAFPAWYLNYVLSQPETIATKNSSDTSEFGGKANYDFGIDAFNLMVKDENTLLILIQAKYSTQINYISKGFRDFKKSLSLLNNMFDKVDTDVPQQNKVLVNLKAALNLLSDEQRLSLQIEFIVIHLSDEDETILAHKTESVRKDLADEVEYKIPNHNVRIKLEGPGDWGKFTQVVPAEWITIKMKGFTNIEHANESKHKMYLGLGYLADLVELYNQRRDNLFSKNVRYFIKSKKNVEKGPSAKMRDTLKDICIGGEESPELFAFYHNGITIYGKDVITDGNNLKVREPYVLNGCQTIKTSFLFRYDSRNKEKIDTNIWNNISIPVRLVTSSNDNLIRKITINNNRQNAMSSAALRANDPIQLDLETRFRECKILYERQEGAKSNIEDTTPELFEAFYNASNFMAVNIVDLARTISAAVGEMNSALSPAHIFEYDNLYNKIFSDKKIHSIAFLIFLQNLHDVIPVVLKKDLNLYDNEYGISKNRLVYFTINLLIKHLEKSRNLDLIYNYGDRLVGKNKLFRDDVAKVLDNYHSKITQQLNKHFMTLDNNRNESLMQSLEKASRLYKSHNNILDLVRDIDDEIFYDNKD
jgi:AIPR protein